MTRHSQHVQEIIDRNAKTSEMTLEEFLRYYLVACRTTPEVRVCVCVCVDPPPFSLLPTPLTPLAQLFAESDDEPALPGL